MNFGWKCYICNKPLLLHEGMHLSSPDWGNVQRHFCSTHAWNYDTPEILTERYYFYLNKINFTNTQKAINMLSVLEIMTNMYLREHDLSDYINFNFLYKQFSSVEVNFEDIKYSSVKENWYIEC